MVTEVDTDLAAAELDSLKARAELLGISFHPNISAEKLSERITEFQKKKEEEKANISDAGKKKSPITKTANIRKEAEKLVRINVTCMNPAKKEWEGEIFTVGNSVVGTHKKYVPFNTEDGWHVPNIIYQMLKNRKCQIFHSVKGANGIDVRESKMIKEFAIDVLDPLTPKEIEELGRRQAMRQGKSD